MPSVSPEPTAIQLASQRLGWGEQSEVRHYYARHGFWGNPNVLACLLGRQPTSFADFLARTMPEWQSG